MAEPEQAMISSATDPAPPASGPQPHPTIRMSQRRAASRPGRRLVGLLALWLGLTAALAAGEEAAPLSLSQSLAMALERNLALRLAERDVQSAESARQQAAAEFFPRLSAQVEATHHSAAPELRVPPITIFGTTLPGTATTISLGGQDTSSLKVTVQQPVFTGLATTSQYRRRALMLDIARSRLRTARHALAFDVVRAYLGVLRAQKAAQLSAQQVKALEAQAAQAQAFFEGGVIPRHDLLKAQVELANARQLAIRARNRLELAIAHFNHILGRDLAAPLRLEEVEPEPPQAVDLEAAMRTAWERRPELEELAQAIAVAQTGVAAAQSQFYPQLNLVGAYTVDLVGGNPHLPAERWEVGSVLQWQAFAGGRVRAQVSEARISLQKALEAWQQWRDRVALEVKEAVLELQEAGQKLGVAEQAIAQAEEHFRIARERYLAQIATSAEVIDAEALLTQARTNYFNALYDHHQAIFALRKATGLILE
jgi:outer membrane protein TolC